MVIHDRVRIQKDCIENICDILGVDVYKSFKGSRKRTRLQAAILETKQNIYPGADPTAIRKWWDHFIQYGDTPAYARRTEVRRYKKRYKQLTNRGNWTEEQTEMLKEIVDQHPEYYLDEIQLVFCLEMKEDWSAPYIWERLIGDCEYSLQKVADKTYHADKELQRQHEEELLLYCTHPNQLVYLDESQKDRNSSRRRRYWYMRGQSPFRDAYFEGTRGKRYTLLAACDWNGFLSNVCETVLQKSSSKDKDTSHGTIDGARILEWVRNKLVPTLGDHQLGQPRSIVVMDNATIHANPEIEALIKSKGAILIKLPPYSPQFNPIEMMFGHYKKQLKRNIHEEWDVAHDIALCSVTPDIARSFFKHSKVPYCDHFPSIKEIQKLNDNSKMNSMITTTMTTAAILMTLD